MTDFVFELLSEEIPARMQAAAAEQLRVRFGDGIKGRVPVDGIDAFATPRRLVLYARGLGAVGNVVSEERRGPRVDAPAAAIEGFLRSTGLAREQLEERATPKGTFLYAVVEQGGRPTTELLADLIPQIIRDFDWPKSMRWGEASRRRDSLRWVRPLTGIVALFGDAVVPFEVDGITSGRTTQGHRFLHSGPVEIADAASYVATLLDAHVIVDAAARARLIAEGARAAAHAAGLTLVEDTGLVAENAGLTEWPVPLLGRFDPAFLDVPREIIQLTMRTNQKYFACVDSAGTLAPAFVCVANIASADGGAAIIAGNQKVLAARLADAKFFWDADLKAGLESFTPKLADIVFHEKLGTLADKVDRVAKLARWLVESGAVRAPLHPSRLREGPGVGERDADAMRLAPPPPSPLPEVGGGAEVAALAALTEKAARLCKADLPSATVGEFPEVQGIAGRYLALAAGIDPQIADAIRDHYKPVGQGDDVPTAPVSVAVALSDKLDTLVGFFMMDELPTGSRDPFALRRSANGILGVINENLLSLKLVHVFDFLYEIVFSQLDRRPGTVLLFENNQKHPLYRQYYNEAALIAGMEVSVKEVKDEALIVGYRDSPLFIVKSKSVTFPRLLAFLADRLKVQQREAGVRPDIIDAVFALGGEDDLVRLLARVHALQAFLRTPDGVNLLAGYKRAANILRIEEARGATFTGDVAAAHLVEPAEIALAATLDTVLPEAQAAVGDEDFAGAMTALSRLRPAVDAFFETVIVNAPDAALRLNRLGLLARFRAAVHTIADFSKIDG